MDTPVEITFHNMPHSNRIEAEILRRAAKLKRYFGRLVACRVSLEARSNHHRTGNIYEVHVEMSVPRGFLVVTREPHHVKERRAHSDVRTSLHEAFEAAEAQLRSFNKKRRDYGRVAKAVELSMGDERFS